MRMNAAQLSQVLKRPGYKTTLHGLCLRAAAASVIGRSKDRMNKTEAEHAMLLEYRKRAGEIKDWGFERVTLRLPGGVRYTPDFDVLGVGGELEIHEIKGAYIRTDGMNKFKQAVEVFSGWTFKMFQKKEGAWTQIR